MTKKKVFYVAAVPDRDGDDESAFLCGTKDGAIRHAERWMQDDDWGDVPDPVILEARVILRGKKPPVRVEWVPEP